MYHVPLSVLNYMDIQVIKVIQDIQEVKVKEAIYVNQLYLFHLT